MNTPPVFPILAAGAHRRPRDGGCFMEIASLLAGLRWSDHPACTHPVLAAVARCVNDATTDDGRQSLTELIPAVVGATSVDPRIAPRLVLTCTDRALLRSGSQHRADLLAGQQAARRRLTRLQGETGPEPSTRVGAAPRHHRWTDVGRRWSEKAYLRVDAPIAIHHAIAALAPRPRVETDGPLRAVLVDAIGELRQSTDSARPRTPGEDIDWAVALRLTGG